MEIPTGAQCHFPKGLLLSGKEETRPQRPGEQVSLSPGDGVSPWNKETLSGKMKVLEKEERGGAESQPHHHCIYGIF